MRNSLFVTGASGFIGARLLAGAAPDRFAEVICLCRNPAALPSALAARPDLSWVQGDLCEPDGYGPLLDGVDTVMHLAAATGNARPEDFARVNVEGTRALVEECARRGVRRLVHVSTIAVNVSDASYYPYARSKQRAEEVVRASGLQWTIVRPTIVLGPEAAIWHRLRALASAPVLLILGDGSTPIQPVYVDDLVACLWSVIEADDFSRGIFEVGGPEVITMEDFLTRVHQRRRGRSPTVVHVPHRLLGAALGLAEPLLHSVLPVGVGQLAPLVNDGSVRSNRLFVRHRPKMRGVDEVLALLLSDV